MLTETLNIAIAVFLLRTVTGILFFFQGYDKLFNIKIGNVARTINNSSEKLKISFFIIKPAIALSSLLEMICGGMLFFGLFKNIDLYLLTGNLIVVAFIFTSIKPMWDMQHYFPRIIFIVILLVSTVAPDIFSFDYIFGIK